MKKKVASEIQKVFNNCPGCVFICAVLCFFQYVSCYAQQSAYVSPAGTKFLLYTPPGYNNGTSTYPLLVSLHSKGEVGDDLNKLTVNNPQQMPSRLIYLNRWPQDLPFIVLTPQLHPTEADPDPQWPAEYIDEVVRYVTANYRVDLNRIYVTGISRGGTGTWTYSSAFPNKVAAIVPISGLSDLAQACPIKNIPIWAFHGDGDGTADPSYSIDMINTINACQPAGIYKPRLNILHARGHNGWNEIYNGSYGYRIWDWLLKFTKNNLTNKTPYVNAGRDLKVKLRTEPLHINGDFFDSDGDITNVQWQQTSGVALTLSNTNSQFLKITDLKTGVFEFQLTVTDNKGAQSSDKVILEIVSATATPSITNLVLMNGKTNTDIGNLSEGQVINKSQLGISEINIRAISNGETGSVRFSVNTDQHTRTINTPGPYLIKGQTTGPEWQIQNGEYVICATPFTKGGGGGIAGVSQCFKITVTDGTSSPSCSGTGEIERELWTGISGTTVSSIPVTTPPSSRTILTVFETPTNSGDNYGSRIRGYVCAPATGSYTFWIASDDRSELWLSTNENPANKIKIAYVNAYTAARQWTKYTTQQSLPVNLESGKKYYIEALHKEAAGGDNLAVGWQLPDGTLERPITGNRLIKFSASGNISPSVTIQSPQAGQSFNAPASITISADASDSDGTISKVEFYNGTTKLGEDITAPYSFSWNNVSAGNYTIQAKAIDNLGASATASVNVSVIAASTCSSEGFITREIWLGIAGTDIASIPVNTTPNTTTTHTSFETPTYVANDYGSRMRGYVCAPLTGNYTFWIASDDNSELWLSTDETVQNKRRIASVTGATGVKIWEKYASQRSTTIALVAGHRYYIEALHKEAAGNDHIAVGWQLPNATLERPIPGNRLSPFGNSSSQQMQARTFTAEASEPELSIYPNPATTGETRLNISSEAFTKSDFVSIQIFNSTNERVFADRIACRENCSSVELDALRLPPGIYFVKTTVKDQVIVKKLLVR